jgi:hypothetical protein
MTGFPIPMALPLASCQPGPIHTTPDGRAWYGRGDRVNPDTQMFEEASLTLTSAPRQGDEIWVDGNSIAIEQNGGQPWPTLDDLECAIAEARAALAGAPRYHAAIAKAKAETACWRARQAVQAARIAVAEAEAAAAREQSEETEWPGGPEDDQPDIDELNHNDHPALTPFQRNTNLT